MSLRQFYPRKNMRRQVAGWKLFVLYATLVVAIGLQISYPLIEGEPLRLVTIATVYWAAVFACHVGLWRCLCHAIFVYHLHLRTTGRTNW
jgi:hypothetical protein